MIKIYKFLLKRELHYIIDWLKHEEKYLSDKEINSQITGNFELLTLTKGRYIECRELRKYIESKL